MKKQGKYDDYKEKVVTAVLGLIGTIAIFWNLSIKGINLSNSLDATKDFAGLVVVLIVFIMTSKLFRRNQIKNFAKVLEGKLDDWIDLNKYLVCKNEGKAIEDSQVQDVSKKPDRLAKKSIMMVKDHSRFVSQEATAEAANTQEKVIFLYLSPLKEKKLDFRFNPTVFAAKNYEISKVITMFHGCLEKSYSSNPSNENGFRISISKDNTDKSIVVSFDNKEFEETEENARKLVEIVEFVKTMILALA